MVHLTRRRGLVTATSPLAVPVPHDHRVADGGRNGLAEADVQRQARPGQPRAELPPPQERRQPAGAGQQIDGLADDGLLERLSVAGGSGAVPASSAGLVWLMSRGLSWLSGVPPASPPPATR